MSWRALTRILSDDKTIESAWLNAVGIQPFRAVTARALDAMTPAIVDASTHESVRTLADDGILVIRDFLAAQRFRDLVEECNSLEKCQARTLRSESGPNTLRHRPLDDTTAAGLPALHGFLNDSRLNAILRAVEKWPWRPLHEYARLQSITYAAGDPDRGDDPQTHLHADVFHCSHKLWLYLDEVTDADGPLAFVKGSHRLRWAHLRSMYRAACRRSAAADRSRRIPLSEQDGLHAEVITCPANTLVIANVCGYHRRLQGRAGAQRRAITISLRNNPFVAHRLRAVMARFPPLYAGLRAVKQTLRPS